MAGTVQGGGGVGKAVAIGCGCFIVIIVVSILLSVASYCFWLFRDMFLPGDRDNHPPINNAKLIDRAYENERILNAEVYEQAADNEELDVPQELLKAHKRAFVEVQRNLKRNMDREGRKRAYHELAVETRGSRRRADPDPQSQESRQPTESQPLETVPQRRAIQRPGRTLLEEK
jgi:hypothetical protein